MLYALKKHKGFKAAIKTLNTSAGKWKLLGTGAYGFAYDMGDGRVCKITTNKNETRAAEKIKNSKKKYSYLYKITDVLTLKKRGRFWRGLIITPKYRQLTDRQKTELYELFCFLELPPSFRIRNVKQIKDRIRKAVSDYYYAPYSYDNTALIDNAVNKRLKIFRKYNILYMLRNLKAVKLGPEDMHYDNILKSDDHYILIDIAC